MFGIEDAITGIRKRIFTMRCVSDTAQVSYITKIVCIYIYNRNTKITFTEN